MYTQDYSTMGKRPPSWRRWSTKVGGNLAGGIVFNMVLFWLVRYIWDMDIYLAERMPSWY